MGSLASDLLYATGGVLLCNWLIDGYRERVQSDLDRISALQDEVARTLADDPLQGEATATRR